MKLVSALLAITMIQFVSGDMILDQWMKQNKLPVEHLHDKMQHHRARGERVRLRVMEDDISSKSAATFEGQLSLINSVIVNL